ncbi:MAG: trypsin-like peptidase domain-containing protein [Clostridia bacterium]|nr:trypsin-like peptidase domain-containing protein [Clostridia bacterium]
MTEYNFDPMTGEPIPKPEQPTISPEPTPAEETSTAEPTATEAPIGNAPTAEQPVYHYAYPRQEEPTAEPAPQPDSANSTFHNGPATPPPPHYGANPTPPPYTAPILKKKEPKPVTTGKFYGGIAIALVCSLLLGLAGGFLGMNLAKNDTVISDGSVVIYKTEKLQGTDEAMTVSQVAALVEPSVVAITTEQVVTGSFMQQYISEGAGSGVIITADGYVVTNHHVIDGATNIKVTLADGNSHTAQLVGSDSKADLAVLKIDATGLQPAAFGNAEELQLAETVVAVGNPLGELEGTVTSGILSALDREITIDNTTMRLLQTDTAINPGNSGGGLFNTSGQLIGVVNAKSAGEEIEGLGFAIPIDTVQKVVEDLITHGYVTGRVDPGFTYVEVNDAMSAMMYRVNELGLYISAVATGSDGAAAGFQSGDYVVSVEGTKVSTAAEAIAIIDKKAVGDTVTFVIKRGGTEMTLPLTLTEYVPTVSNQTQNQTQLQSPFPSFF